MRRWMFMERRSGRGDGVAARGAPVRGGTWHVAVTARRVAAGSGSVGRRRGGLGNASSGGTGRGFDRHVAARRVQAWRGRVGRSRRGPAWSDATASGPTWHSWARRGMALLGGAVVACCGVATQGMPRPRGPGGATQVPAALDEARQARSRRSRHVLVGRGWARPSEVRRSWLGTSRRVRGQARRGPASSGAAVEARLRETGPVRTSAGQAACKAVESGRGCSSRLQAGLGGPCTSRRGGAWLVDATQGPLRRSRRYGATRGWVSHAGGKAGRGGRGTASKGASVRGLSRLVAVRRSLEWLCNA